MSPEQMYQMFAAAMPVAVENPVRRVPATVKPASYMDKGLSQLKAIADKCPRGNYATGRPMSYSSLKEFRKHPLYYVNYVQSIETAPTKSQILGLIYENLLVRGCLPDKIVCADSRPIPDKDFRAKANAEWKTEMEQKGLTVVDAETIQTARDMANIVSACDFVRNRLGNFESCQYQAKGLKTICNIDITSVADVLIPWCVVELKTTNNLATFGRQFYDDYSYWLQCVIQHVVFEKPVYVIAVQSEPPHLFGIYAITDEQLSEWKRRLGSLLRQFRSSLRHGFRQDESILELEPTYQFKRSEI